MIRSITFITQADGVTVRLHIHLSDGSTVRVKCPSTRAAYNTARTVLLQGVYDLPETAELHRQMKEQIDDWPF